MMKYLQKLGKSLMLPVACLPVASILMGIGYWIDPSGWGGKQYNCSIPNKSWRLINRQHGYIICNWCWCRHV